MTDTQFEYGLIQSPAAKAYDAMYEMTNEDGGEFLILCCEGGDIPEASWATEAFDLIETLSDDNKKEAFRRACAHDNIDIAMWFNDKFGPLPPNTTREAFYDACKYAHLKCAQWLHATFHFSDDNASDALGIILEEAERERAPPHKGIIKWLGDTFEIVVNPTNNSYDGM